MRKLLTCLSICLLVVSASSIQAFGAEPRAVAALTITSVSNPKPQFVSGGDVLVRVTPPAGGATVSIQANGRDVRPSFAVQADGSLLGLVTGLQNGANTLTAASGGDSASLSVRSYPLSGPVFSGPQQLPFYCETTGFGLAAATSPLCSAPSVVSYQYKKTTGAFAALADPTTRPTDLATTTVGGRTVPYIVRVERGTIDRAVYEIAALYDGSAPTPLRSEGSWNGKLAYTFGPGCNGGYHQGNLTGGVLNDVFLSRGYAVASSTLNVPEVNCSTIISAEAAMMVKEHFIETYGPTQFTIGWGASGGSINQHEIADAYPGILDGIIPGDSFPDMATVFSNVADCSVLTNYFNTGEGFFLTETQKQAVTGYINRSSCSTWKSTFQSKIQPASTCNSLGAAIPSAAIYNASTNPNGVKCAASEQWVNQFGRDPATGMVRSTIDNVGVQYGLKTLLNHTITPAQFASLNLNVGSLDTKGAPVVKARATADPTALAAAYRDNLLLNGGQGLRDIPIIDQRLYADQVGFPFDIHTTETSFVTRDRLLRANGTTANQVIIESPLDLAQTGVPAQFELDAMDRWLTAIKADTSSQTAPQKVIADKPSDLGDGCYLASGTRILQALNYPPTGQCGTQYPVGANPRLIAGADLGLTTLKCALKPLNFADYPVTFTAADQTKLRQAFPSGVCDYTRPGVGQQAPQGPWLTY